MTFAKGQSGNPNGRPKVLLPDGRSLSDVAKEQTLPAIETLIAMMAPEVPHATRVAAANSLLDRGWGKPAQMIIGDPDNPIVVESKQSRDAAVAAALIADA